MDDQSLIEDEKTAIEMISDQYQSWSEINLISHQMWMEKRNL